MKHLIKFIPIVLIIGIIIYIFSDYLNKENIDSDDKKTNETNNITIDDDYDTSYNKNNNIDLDNLTCTNRIQKNNNIFTITNSGDYYISGTGNAQIVIDANDNNIVHLILDSANLTYDYSPIYVKKAKKVIITVLGENNISDKDNYTSDDTDATIYSKDDLVINGDGKLIINGNYQNGIVSKDSLKIINTDIKVISINTGIKGKDYVYLENTTIDITSSGDGIKSTNDSDETQGFITIKGGTYKINSETDGIQAETILYIENGTFDITSGNGSQNSSKDNSKWGYWGSNDDNKSAKGLKAGESIIIDNGEFNINSSDDSIHSNDEIIIKNGKFVISSGDDGIHADNNLTINDGDIDINKSYEGVEATVININGGNININSSDDGINVAGGDGSSYDRPGSNNFSGTTGTLKINGGNIVVNASGDGLDANGNIYINGGNTIIYGPTDNGNCALDYDGVLEITDGSLIASGSSGMAQMPGEDSSINSVMINFNQTITSDKVVTIKNSSDEEIINYKADKSYTNLVISNDKLSNGDYTIYIDDEKYDTFTISSITTKVGNTQNVNMMTRDDMRRPR